MSAKLSRLLLTLALLFSCALALPSCQVAPNYPVDSYEELKEALANQPDIVFPDISKYEESNLMCYRVELRGKNRIHDGYSVYAADSPFIKKLYLEANTVFSLFGIDCYNLEHYGGGDEDSAFSGWKRTIYRGVTFYGIEGESSWYDEEGRLGDEPDDIFPLGTRVGALSYGFDFNGYRYLFDAEIALLPEEQTYTTYEEKMAQAKDELMVLVDDVLDKGGAVR